MLHPSRMPDDMQERLRRREALRAQKRRQAEARGLMPPHRGAKDLRSGIGEWIEVTLAQLAKLARTLRYARRTGQVDFRFFALK